VVGVEDHADGAGEGDGFLDADGEVGVLAGLKGGLLAVNPGFGVLGEVGVRDEEGGRCDVTVACEADNVVDVGIGEGAEGEARGLERGGGSRGPSLATEDTAWHRCRIREPICAHLWNLWLAFSPATRR
jgi:hypothetical protein